MNTNVPKHECPRIYGHEWNSLLGQIFVYIVALTEILFKFDHNSSTKTCIEDWFLSHWCIFQQKAWSINLHFIYFHWCAHTYQSLNEYYLLSLENQYQYGNKTRETFYDDLWLLSTDSFHDFTLLSTVHWLVINTWLQLGQLSSE